jgi:hypothetical protein
MSYVIISCHFISHLIMSCHVMSCHVMSCHVMSCHVTSYHVFSFFTTHAIGISILVVIHIAILILLHVYVYLYVCYLDWRASLTIIFNSFTFRPVRHICLLSERERGTKWSSTFSLICYLLSEIKSIFYNFLLIYHSLLFLSHTLSALLLLNS